MEAIIQARLKLPAVCLLIGTVFLLCSNVNINSVSLFNRGTINNYQETNQNQEIKVHIPTQPKIQSKKTIRKNKKLRCPK